MRCTVGSGMELWLSLGQGPNIGPQKLKGSNWILQAKYQNYETFSQNYEQKVVVLNSKAAINFKIIQGVDIFSQAAEICDGLADNFNQELATLKSGAKDLVWLRCCVSLLLGHCFTWKGQSRLCFFSFHLPPTWTRHCELNTVRYLPKK